MLGTKDEIEERKTYEKYKREKRRVKSCIYQSKKKTNKHASRKMNQDVSRNRKLFLKEVGKLNSAKTESCNRIKDRTRRG